jgi:hypothetical protein
LATSCCELDDDDLWGTERVRAAAVDFKEERGTTTLTRGDGGMVWTARRRHNAQTARQRRDARTVGVAASDSAR